MTYHVIVPEYCGVLEDILLVTKSEKKASKLWMDEWRTILNEWRFYDGEDWLAENPLETEQDFTDAINIYTDGYGDDFIHWLTYPEEA